MPYRIFLMAALLGCSPTSSVTDGGPADATADVAADVSPPSDAGKDAPGEAATSFCTGRDAALCADFDLYPYVMTFSTFGQGDAGLDTTMFLSPPASAHFFAPAGTNGASAVKSATGTGTHLHVELDVRIATSGLINPVALLRFSVSAAGTMEEIRYVFDSSSAELDVNVVADGGGTSQPPIAATLPPIGTWTHVTFDAALVQSGSVTIAFDGKVAGTGSANLSLPSTQVSFGANVDDASQMSATPLNTSVDVYADNVVGFVTP